MSIRHRPSILRAAAVLVAVVAVVGPLPAQSPFGKDSALPPVIPSLVADRDAVAPGQTFRLGVLFSIEPKWHIYWRNSGDAGFQTTIAWAATDALTIGPLQWPAPHLFIEEGDVETYGYESEVILWVEATVAADAAPGTTLTIGAETSWLMCKKLCIPGDKSLSLKLPVAEEAIVSRRVAHFDQMADLVPARLDAADDAAMAAAGLRAAFVRDARGPAFLITGATARDGGRVVATAKPYRALTFFPEGELALHIERPVATIDGDTFTVRVPLRKPIPDGGPLRGVVTLPLAAEEGAAARLAAFDLSIPSTPAANADGTAVDGAGLAVHTNGGGPSGALTTDFTEQGQGFFLSFGLAGQLLLAFVGGLLLNVMPCVLPVISLKVMSLAKQGGEDPRRVFRLGLVFSLGIWTCFMALAIPIAVLRATGDQVGWGLTFQEPYFNFAMMLLLFGFGLSLLGAFEISLPGVASDVLAKGARREGYLGAFFNGCLATILSTPCMAPFVGSAVGYALTQSVATILLFFTAIALGLASPFLLLAARPAWTAHLPKPGAWMETIKKAMGLALLGSAIFPFHVLTKAAEDVDGLGGRLDGVPTQMLLFLLGLTLALSLIGHYAGLGVGRGRRLAVWVAALAVGWVSYSAAIAEPLHSMQTRTLPDRITWVDFTPEELERRLGLGETVFIDFTASWCITCGFNEEWIIDTPEVRDVLSRNGIVPMRADWSRRDAVIAEFLAKFGRAGVPFYVVFPGDRPTQPIVLPEVITQSMLIEAFRKAS